MEGPLLATVLYSLMGRDCDDALQLTAMCGDG
jgi:hypothetical protein